MSKEEVHKHVQKQRELERMHPLIRRLRSINRHDIVGGVVAILILATIFGGMIVGYDAMQRQFANERRLMDQCLADGKKEYECRSILNSGSTTYIPIVIPVR